MSEQDIAQRQQAKSGVLYFACDLLLCTSKMPTTSQLKHHNNCEWILVGVVTNKSCISILRLNQCKLGSCLIRSRSNDLVYSNKSECDTKVPYFFRECEVALFLNAIVTTLCNN